MSAHRGQDGFTVVEVLVAALVLTLGIISLVGAFDPARRLGTNAEKRQVGSARAEQELDRIRSLPWNQIALKAQPTKNAGATPADPTYYITSSCPVTTAPVSGSPCYQWDWKKASSQEVLDVDTTNGDSTPNPQSWTTTISTSNGSVRLSGKTYRFITWANDTECTNPTCGAANDYRRVTVAVTVNGLDTPVEMSTLVTDPVGGYDPLTESGVTCMDQGVAVSCIG